MNSELSQLKNIGGATESWLNEIGVYTRDDLVGLGAVDAYKILRKRGRRVNAVFLYAVQGAILDMHWQKIADELKKQRRTEAAQ